MASEATMPPPSSSTQCASMTSPRPTVMGMRRSKMKPWYLFSKNRLSTKRQPRLASPTGSPLTMMRTSRVGLGDQK